MDARHADSWYRELTGMLISLLGGTKAEPSRCEAEAQALIAHEVRRHATHALVQSSDDVCACLARLSNTALRDIRSRSVYYASRGLIEALTYRRLRHNALTREEALLYVQDRLQRDDFRRIDSFDAASGASIRTYLWQVISRLLIDFVRNRSLDEEAPETDDEAIPSEDPSSDTATAEQQLQEILRGVFTEHGTHLIQNHALRERLRERLRLTSSERLFLKALFQFDMPIEEIRTLPGFQMSSSEAWRFYYRLLERLLETFKQADALAALHGMIDASESRLTLQLNQHSVDVTASSIHYVKAVDAGSCSCEATLRGALIHARIDEGFARLKKRLAPWFSPVNPTTLIADKWLAALADRWSDDRLQAIEIPGIGERFPIGRSQRAVLIERYAAKKSASDSYTDTEADGTSSLPEARRP